MVHLQTRGAVQEQQLQELPRIEVQEAVQEVVALLAAQVHEAINPIELPHQGQGAVATDPVVAVQVHEAVAIEVLAAAQEAPPVIEVVAQEGLLQEQGLQAVQVEGEVTKPINQQKNI